MKELLAVDRRRYPRKKKTKMRIKRIISGVETPMPIFVAFERPPFMSGGGVGCVSVLGVVTDVPAVVVVVVEGVHPGLSSLRISISVLCHRTWMLYALKAPRLADV